jgi:hypothetical protein
LKSNARGIPALLFAAAAPLLGCGLLPYALLRSWGDRLARDGSLELLTPSLVGLLRPLFLAGGLLLLAGGLACLLRPAWARALAAFPRRLFQDALDILRVLAAVRLSLFEKAGLALSLAAGAWVRLVLLRAPMQYDEAYTWIAFAARPFTAVLTDYHLPNNHVFHTLLVRLSALLFGPEPWALRLPAFLAGLLMIPAAWLAGRALFSPRAGLLAAALVSAWPYLVEYGANARGYTLTGLFTLLLFALTPFLLARRNAFAWLLVSLLCALGLFTIPVMLYPAGIFFTFLLLSSARSGPFRAVWRYPAFLAALAASALAAAALTFLLYLPILVVSGPGALFANPFVRSYSWAAWLAGLNSWVPGIFNSWVTGLTPVWIWFPVFALALVSLWVQPRKPGVPPLEAALLFLVVALPLQRPELQAKAFFNIVPLVLLGSAAGLNAFLERLRPPRVLSLANAVFAAALLALPTWCLLQARPSLPYLLHGDKGAWQVASEYVAARVQPGDAVLIAFPFDPQVWYYGNRSGIPLTAFQLEKFDRAWVLASKPLAEVLRDRGPKDPPLRPEDCRLDADVMSVPIYLCQRLP